MIAIQLARVVLHLFRGLAICALLFPFIDATRRRGHVQRWSHKLLVLCRARLEVISLTGAETSSHALIVANHVSWLDIFAINSLHPCHFVAKSDIREWPLIGWLCEKAGTIFIARGRLRDVRRIYEGLVTSLHAGECVAFFPEGATAPQGAILPFHANLFEAAIEAQVPIQPYALRYVDGRNRPSPAADFAGEMTFVQSLVKILKAEPMNVQLMLLPLIETGPTSHRRELADAAHASIASALATAERDRTLA